MAKRESSGSGNKRVNDLLNSVNRLISGIEKFDGTTATGTIKIDDQASESMERVEEEYESIQKKTKKPIKIDITSDTIFSSDKISQRISEITAQLDKSIQKISNGELLGPKQAEMFMRNYMELENYMNRVQGKIESRYTDMFQNIKGSILGGNKSYVDWIPQVNPGLQKGIEKDFKNAATKAANRNWNSARRELENVNSAIDVEELSRTEEQITRISNEVIELSERMSALFYQDIKKNGDNDYFDEKIQEMEEVKQKANELRTSLQNIELPKGKGELKNRVNESLSVITGIQSDASRKTDEIITMRDNAIKEAQELEEAAEQAKKRRVDAIQSMIKSNPDFEQFGNQKMLNDAIEEAKQAEDTAEAIQEIYQRVIEKMAKAKQEFEDQQKHMQEVQAKRQQLDDFFKEISDGDSERERQYKRDFADYYNKMLDDSNSAEDAIAAISARLGLTERKSSSSSGNRFQDEIDDYEDDIQNYYDTIEQIREKARNAYELEDHSTIYDDYDYNERTDRWREEIDSEEDRIKELSRLSEMWQKQKEKLQEKLSTSEKNYQSAVDNDDLDTALTESENIEKYYKQLLKAQDLSDYIQKQLSQSLSNYTPGDSWNEEAISWLVATLKDLVQEIQNVSKALGQVDEENGITSLLSQFHNMDTNISKAFDPQNLEAFSSNLDDIFKKLEAIGDAIGLIGSGKTKRARGNDLSLREFFLKNMNKFGSMNEFKISDDKGQKNEVRTREYLMKQADRYTDAYDKIFEKYKKRDPIMNGSQMFLSGLLNSRTFREENYGLDTWSEYSRQNVVDKYTDPEQRIRSVMTFIKSVTTAIDELMDEEVWQAFHDEIYKDIHDQEKPEIKSFEDWKSVNKNKYESYLKQQADGSDTSFSGYYDVWKYLKSSQSPSSSMANIRSEIAKMNDIKRTKKKGEQEENEDDSFMGLIGNLSKIKDYSQQIESFGESISGLQTTLKQGLGITEIEGEEGKFTSFLSEIISKMDEVAKAAQQMAKAIGDSIDQLNLEEGTNLGEKIQNQIDSKEYTAKVSIDPASTITDDIQKTLDSKKFEVKIDTDVNTGKKDGNTIKDSETPVSSDDTSDTKEDTSQSMSKEAESFNQIAQMASKAASAKESFVSANEKVISSASSAEGIISKEATAFEQIATEARKAAESKGEFVDIISGKPIVGDIETNDLAKSLSDDFNIDSHSSKIRGIVRDSVNELSSLLSSVYNGETFDIDSLGNAFKNVRSELEGVLARQLTGTNDPMQDLWEGFYNDYKNKIIRISEYEMAELGGPAYQDLVSGSGRISRTKGELMDNGLFAEMYERYRPLFDNLKQIEGYNFDAQGDQILAFLQLMQQAKARLSNDEFSIIDDDELQGNLTTAYQKVDAVISRIESRIREATTIQQENDLLGENFKKNIEESGPYKIDLQPKDTLVEAIQSMLSGHQFNVNLKLGQLAGGESPADLITQMVGADRILGAVKGRNALRERGMAFNSKTGYHTTPFLSDENKTFSSALTDAVLSYATESVDTWMHTHPDLYPAFSLSNEKNGKYSGDLKAAYSAYKKHGINTEINAAQNGVAVFNAKAFYDQYGSLFEDDKIDQTMESIYKVRKEVENKFKNSVQSLSKVFDIEAFDIPIEQILGNNFDLPDLVPKFKDMLIKVWGNSSNELNSIDFTNDLIKYIDTLPNDYNKTIKQAFVDFLRGSFENIGLDAKDIEMYLGDGKDFSIAIGNAFESWFGKLMDGENYFARIRQMITPEILSKSIGFDAKDYGKFFQYLTIPQFKEQFGINSGGYTDPYNGIANAATSASKSKEDVAQANKDVQASVDGTVPKLEEEAMEFNAIDDSAEKAADSKSKVAEENEKLADESNVDQKKPESNDVGFSKLAEETSKFVRESQQVLDEFGVTIDQIPIEWQSCMNRISNDGADATTVINELREALEKLNQTPPPDNDNFIPSQDGVYTTQRGMVGDDSYSYTERLGFAQKKIVNVRRDEEEGEIPTEQIQTDFEKLENEIIKVDQQILTLWDDFEKARSLGKPTDAIQQTLTMLGEKSSRLTRELNTYYDEHGYMPGSAQVQDFSRRRQEAGQMTQLNIQRKNEAQYDKDWAAAIRENAAMQEREQKAISKTNIFIQDQVSELDRLTERYIENAKVAISDEDKKSLSQLHTNIQKMIFGVDENTTDEEKNAIKNKIKDYQQQARLAISRQEVAMEMQARSPEAAKEKQLSQLTKLLSDMKKSGADTQDLERQVNELISSFKASTDKTKEHFTNVRNQYNILKEQFTQANEQFNFDQSQLQNAEKALSNYEKSVENFVKAKAALDFGDDKDPALAEQFEKAKQAMIEAREELSKFSAVFAENFVPDKDKYMDRMETALDKEANPTNAPQYLSKQKQAEDKYRKQMQKDLKAQLEEQFAIIKNAEDLQTRKNMSDVAQMRGGSTGENIEKLTQELLEAKQAAKQARDEIVQLLDVSDDVFDEDVLTKYKNRLDNDYKRSEQGSVSSRRTLANARKQERSSEVKQTLTEYANAMTDYQKLFQKSISGNISVAEEKQMESSLASIIQIESQWNEEKAKGITLTDKQKNALEALKAAQESNADENGISTKEVLEQQAMREKARAEYVKLSRQINNMYDQGSWRAGAKDDKGINIDWNDKINKLSDSLGNVDIDSITDEASLNNVLELLQKIRMERQEIAKGTEWRPIAQDWQAKTENNLVKWMDQNKIAAKAFKQELDELRASIKEVGSQEAAEKWNADLARIQTKAADRGLLGKSLGDRFKDQFKNTMTSLATYYLSFQDFIRYGREAIQTITELDTQLTEMRKVSNESLQTLQDYQLETFDIADRVGTTAAQISASTADWMRLGEDLSDAKKSAEYSTMLLNVSEFQDINTATESLVAMSQAYQELDKIDIIDKLNNIGNNFSISTSELAESLQRSAGTLKVAGNSIDESIALTVAGNQVLQNPQMVGQSLRTIALRLTGTSIEDMQEAGEEIDGLITTQSKLRATIMDATKVSGNNYQGFDILDDNGNYKTTYEMLKGIASVWKQIGEEDKKMGTNRQSFLLETIAGLTLCSQ